MPISTETDRLHLSRAIELAERGRGPREPQPAGRRRDRPGRRGARRGLARRARRPARRGRGDRRGRRRPGRRDDLRLARAVLPPRAHAAVHRRDRRGRASAAWSSPPTIPPRRPPAAAWASCATRASRSTMADGELADRARLLNQPFRKHARTGRPWVLFKSAMTLDGKVATETGDSKWISGEAQPRAARTAGAAECDAVAVGHRHRAGRRPAAHRPRRRRRPPAAPRGLRLRGAPAARLQAGAGAAERGAAHRRGLPRGAADRRRPRCSRRRRRDRRRHRRERARPRALGARPARRPRA